MIEQLAFVTRVVADQDRSVTFYTETLGFEVVRDHDGPHGRFVTVAPPTDEQVELILVTPEGFDEPEASRLETLIGNDSGLIYRVDDCRQTVETLQERGVRLLSGPDRMPWGTQAELADPDGNEIMLQEPASPEHA